MYMGNPQHMTVAGQFPFRRGIHQSMYRGKLWTMRQYAGFGNASSANERYRYLLSQGTTGLSVAFDLPTQMGRDADHPVSKGEVGRVGVSISTLQDMEDLLDQIPLSEVSISMTINATALILLSMLCCVVKKNNSEISKLRGTTQNDILKEYIARGTYIYPPKGAMKLTTDLISYCHTNIPLWNTISISGYHIREAGSTAEQEIAFTLADGIAYVQAALYAGLQIDDFAPRLSFFFNCHNNFFEEIAKFRAARQLWATIMKERFGAKKDQSMQLRFHTQTAGSSLTAQQPYNNIVRTTLQGLAAVLGGTQSLHTNSFDEALGLPTQVAATIALRTQQIIGYESGVASVVDPLGGSEYIESLTDSLIESSTKIIEKIDSLGGMLSAIENGYPQQEIEKASYKYQQAIESKLQIVVGVNAFESSDQDNIPVAKPSLEDEKKQIERVCAYKSARSGLHVKNSLAALSSGITMGENAMPLTIDCLLAGATLGEISDEFRGVFGEYKP